MSCQRNSCERNITEELEIWMQNTYEKHPEIIEYYHSNHYKSVSLDYNHKSLGDIDESTISDDKVFEGETVYQSTVPVNEISTDSCKNVLKEIDGQPEINKSSQTGHKRLASGDPKIDPPENLVLEGTEKRNKVEEDKKKLIDSKILGPSRNSEINMNEEDRNMNLKKISKLKTGIFSARRESLRSQALREKRRSQEENYDPTKRMKLDDDKNNNDSSLDENELKKSLSLIEDYNETNISNQNICQKNLKKVIDVLKTTISERDPRVRNRIQESSQPQNNVTLSKSLLSSKKQVDNVKLKKEKKNENLEVNGGVHKKDCKPQMLIERKEKELETVKKNYGKSEKNAFYKDNVSVPVKHNTKKEKPALKISAEKIVRDSCSSSNVQPSESGASTTITHGERMANEKLSNELRLFLKKQRTSLSEYFIVKEGEVNCKATVMLVDINEKIPSVEHIKESTGKAEKNKVPSQNAFSKSRHIPKELSNVNDILKKNYSQEQTNLEINSKILVDNLDGNMKISVENNKERIKQRQIVNVASRKESSSKSKNENIAKKLSNVDKASNHKFGLEQSNLDKSKKEDETTKNKFAPKQICHEKSRKAIDRSTCEIKDCNTFKDNRKCNHESLSTKSNLILTNDKDNGNKDKHNHKHKKKSRKHSHHSKEKVKSDHKNGKNEDKTVSRSEGFCKSKDSSTYKSREHSKHKSRISDRSKEESNNKDSCAGTSNNISKIIKTNSFKMPYQVKIRIDKDKIDSSILNQLKSDLTGKEVSPSKEFSHSKKIINENLDKQISDCDIEYHLANLSGNNIDGTFSNGNKNDITDTKNSDPSVNKSSDISVKSCEAMVNKEQGEMYKGPTIEPLKETAASVEPIVTKDNLSINSERISSTHNDKITVDLTKNNSDACGEIFNKNFDKFYNFIKIKKEEIDDDVIFVSEINISSLDYNNEARLQNLNECYEEFAYIYSFFSFASTLKNTYDTCVRENNMDNITGHQISVLTKELPNQVHINVIKATTIMSRIKLFSNASDWNAKSLIDTVIKPVYEVILSKDPEVTFEAFQNFVLQFTSVKSRKELIDRYKTSGDCTSRNDYSCQSTIITNRAISNQPSLDFTQTPSSNNIGQVTCVPTVSLMPFQSLSSNQQSNSASNQVIQNVENSQYQNYFQPSQLGAPQSSNQPPLMMSQPQMMMSQTQLTQPQNHFTAESNQGLPYNQMQSALQQPPPFPEQNQMMPSQSRILQQSQMIPDQSQLQTRKLPPMRNSSKDESANIEIAWMSNYVHHLHPSRGSGSAKDDRQRSLMFSSMAEPPLRTPSMIPPLSYPLIYKAPEFTSSTIYQAPQFKQPPPYQIDNSGNQSSTAHHFPQTFYNRQSHQPEVPQPKTDKAKKSGVQANNANIRPVPPTPVPQNLNRGKTSVERTTYPLPNVYKNDTYKPNNNLQYLNAMNKSTCYFHQGNNVTATGVPSVNIAYKNDRNVPFLNVQNLNNHVMESATGQNWKERQNRREPENQVENDKSISCEACSNPATLMCSKCCCAAYCSEACAVKHWRNQHYEFCQKIQESTHRSAPSS